MATQDDRYDRFTDQVKDALRFSLEEGRRMNHNYVGTEHLLLGILRVEEGVAYEVLTELGLTLDKVRQAVEILIGRGDRMVAGEVGLTPRAKKIIELAIDEARRQESPTVGTEHLLLGLIREGEGIAAGIIESIGHSFPTVRERVFAKLQEKKQ